MSGLTVSINDFLELIGPVATIHLCETFGGNELYVPRITEEKKGHKIVEAIGMDAALSLSEEYQGERIEVPMLKKKHHREKVLTAVKEQGLSKADASRRLKLSNRWVRNICNREKHPGQLDLL